MPSLFEYLRHLEEWDVVKKYNINVAAVELIFSISILHKFDSL